MLTSESLTLFAWKYGMIYHTFILAVMC